MARLRQPASLDDAIALLADGPPGAVSPIAGGVGLSLAMALGGPAPADLVAVGQLQELRAIEHESSDILCGAAVTIAELADGHALVPDLLVAAAADVANPGMREVATIGGNLVAGGAASDLLAALLALGASLDVVGPGGTLERSPVDAPVAGGWLVRAIRIPAAACGWGWQRLTIRGAMDRSCATVAAVIAPDGIRVALSVAPRRAIRLAAVEAAAVEAVGVDGAGRRAREAAGADLASIELRPDDRASGAYRRQVIPVLVERAVRSALSTASA